MAYRKVNFAIGEYYHLYNRGIEKRSIFLDKKDYQHFLRLMYLCNSTRSITIRDIGETFDRVKTIVDIGAYCLMPNHFHILVLEKSDGGISLYMKKLLTAYSMFFNKKYKRTGRLFENTFKASHSASDRYLKYLYAYIHLNPAKMIDRDWKTKRSHPFSKLWEYVSIYPYSSFSEYISTNNQHEKQTILQPSAFPGYFLTPSVHKKELQEWLSLESTP